MPAGRQTAPARMARALAHLLTHHACLRAALGLLSALAFGPPPAQAAVTEAWVHRYSNVVSNSNDQAVKVVRDAAGDVFVTGTTDDRINGRDMLTIKYSGADGSVLWQKRYNSPANSDDYATAVAVDGSGNVVVTGSSDSGTNGYDDYSTAKYAAASGALLWEKCYNGPANSNDRANAVAVDDSGNVVVTGSTDGSGNSYENYSDFYTAKYAAADGALLWEKRYNGPANKRDQAQAVAVDASGNVVVTGISDAIFDCDDCDWQGDYYTAKYAAADGALLWEQRYNGPGSFSYDHAQAVAVDGSGNVVVTGYSATIKYLASGAGVWTNNGSATALAVDGSGNVVVTGSSWNGSNSDYYTAKYAAADGALLWEKRYNGPANGDDRVDFVPEVSGACGY